jgi:hypothetical protein
MMISETTGSKMGCPCILSSSKTMNRLVQQFEIFRGIQQIVELSALVIGSQHVQEILDIEIPVFDPVLLQDGHIVRLQVFIERVETRE